MTMRGKTSWPIWKGQSPEERQKACSGRVVRALHHSSVIVVLRPFLPCRDYRAMPELDRYDPDAIDDEDVGEDVTFEEAAAQRLRAEREMERRDEREGRAPGRRVRLPGALEGINLPACCENTPLSMK